MEEIEAPTEQAQEDIHHHALQSRERWISWVALSSALLAVLAAVTALLSAGHANEAVIEQMHASDQWSYYQAKGVKAAVLGTKLDLLSAMGKKAPEKDREKLDDYKKEQEEISKEAKEAELSSRSHLQHHEVYARGVTMFQVAIGIAAIAVLTRQRHWFLLGLAFGAAGIVFLTQGLLLR